MNKSEKQKQKRLDFIKKSFLKNLKINDCHSISILHDKEQRFLIAKTKFLAQFLEIENLISDKTRRQIINKCSNCVLYCEELDKNVWKHLLNIYRKDRQKNERTF